ncbi:Histone-lysine N-methyltransferase SETMAR [Eumeta japonica]|uniref:Histone-lysine N-methyltransferase SETMAR n=1 Tax=Eumeta variegata TaxID=151549 RepID=A0A4C1U767_EUMVA|nr:Histone-lysine N-methyltransferase SETMAR [Eumeta japonica]
MTMKDDYFLFKHDHVNLSDEFHDDGPSTTYHPDKNKDPNAPNNFIVITEAYNVLNNSSSRALYDRTLNFEYNNGYMYRTHVPYNLRNNPRYSYYYETSKAQGTKQQKENSQYGVNGLNKIPNYVLIALCFCFALVGFVVQMMIIRKTFFIHRDKLNERSKRLAKDLDNAKRAADENGNLFFRNLRLRIRWSKKWARLFQQGRESCEDDPRSGRPVTVVTERNVRKIEKLVLADRRIKLWHITEELQISKERVGEIIHEHMNMRKISACWVPKMLTPFDKQRRLQTSKDFLELVGDNIDEICDRIVTVDETWVCQYDPESKQESMQWTKKGERPPKKFKVQKHERQSYRSDVGSYRAECCFLQNNASVHTARVSRQALKDTGFSEIDHPPYSPDLAPSDYFLFSKLKKELRGRRFVDDNQMKMAVESHFDCKEKEYFLGGLKLQTKIMMNKIINSSTPTVATATLGKELANDKNDRPV